MTRVFCDCCGKTLKDDYSNAVNLDWSYFGISGFTAQKKSYQFCAECAKKLDDLIYKNMATVKVSVTVEKEE